VKLGIFTVLFSELTVFDVVAIAQELNVDAIEIGVANYPETSHLANLAEDRAIGEFMEALARVGLEISALSCQGNPLHPRSEIAEAHHSGWLRTLEWARRLQVDTVNVFSGCPGTPAGGDYPNWVTTAWPPDYPELLAWQWDKRVVPYWQRAVETASAQGVHRVAIEMHPGFVVYNPYTLLKLRDLVGPQIGANLDLSHLIWQGIDPLEAIREIASQGALFHFHAKDVAIDQRRTALNGVLDSRPYQDHRWRSWNFCTVGYGHGAEFWATVIQELRRWTYDGVLSIEHEDPLASRDEGLRHAIEFLRPLLWSEPVSQNLWWT
jgi:sugar phosphate isomerase/epimerase